MNDQTANSENTLDDAAANQIAELFRALGDPGRVRMIAALALTEHSVGDLAAVVDLSPSAVSHHLRHLRQMKLVRQRKEGRHVFYSLDDDHVTEIFQSGLEHVRHG